MSCGVLVPQPGIKLTSPALEGRFLPTGPPYSLIVSSYYYSCWRVFISPGCCDTSIHDSHSISISISHSFNQEFVLNVSYVPGISLGFLGSSAGKESACNEWDPGSIPGLGRSPGGEHGNPLQYSCLENPHGQRSLVGYSPWGCRKSGMTERLITAQHSTAQHRGTKIATTQSLSWRSSQTSGERHTNNMTQNCYTRVRTWWSEHSGLMRQQHLWTLLAWSESWRMALNLPGKQRKEVCLDPKPA